MKDFLAEILAVARDGVAARAARKPLAELKREAAGGGRRGRFIEALSAPGTAVIAEVKRASPSKGMLHPDLDAAETAALYEEAGAAAVSVLTEERYFRGSLEDLRRARAACGLPLLRKDFIVDPYQVWEAAAAGADCVLLIAAALPGAELERLAAAVGEAGLDCLVEVHDRRELERALAAGAPLVGINNRDLKTFAVRLETTIELAPLVPGGVTVVGESGIRGADDVRRLAAAGVDAVLVGELLVRGGSPAGKLAELVAAGRP